MLSWERAISTVSVRRPHLFRIGLYVSKCLQRNAQHIHSIYLYTELYQIKFSDKIIHTISKLMNMPALKQQITSPS